jgi:hypothetical protein
MNVCKTATLLFGMIGVAAGAGPAQWPSYHGPGGNFTVPAPSVPLVDDLSQANLPP